MTIGYAVHAGISEDEHNGYGGRFPSHTWTRTVGSPVGRHRIVQRIEGSGGLPLLEPAMRCTHPPDKWSNLGCRSRTIRKVASWNLVRAEWQPEVRMQEANPKQNEVLRAW